MKKPFNWKLFLILVVAAVLGSFAVIPYSLALSASGPTSPPPLTWLLAVLALVQALVLFGLAAGVGLLLANRIGLGLPILEAALRREPAGGAIKDMLPASITLGAVAGVLIILLEAVVFKPLMAGELGANAAALEVAAAQPTAWQGFLASFYGGINEEILLRLFLMTLLAWLGHFLSKTADGRPTTAVLWTANVLAAVVFGLAHLPTVALLVPLTTMVVVRTVFLNALGGIIFGYLYMKRGLESAIVAHFTADLVLHVIFRI